MFARPGRLDRDGSSPCFVLTFPLAAAHDNLALVQNYVVALAAGLHQQISVQFVDNHDE